MSEVKKAFWVKNIEGAKGTLQEIKVFRLDPPLEGYAHVRVSAVSMPAYSIFETYIFGCDENGENVDYSELEGSKQGIFSIDEALANAGYVVG